ncbi:MAG: OmpA family protein [Polaromonas sp.]|uniref:OmpA family protein n=1 Tax=Polaromonas sp. TaxID=1869339 RepID=UPI00271E25F3|nr:OmpA family protein [Polaromonas sp.]MDO9112196.1 OmpA family protein [Polaromonas sp.]MDP1886033.1 OmpA family protein [Polaromonas sp.]
MSSPSDDEQLGLVLGLVFALVALVIALVIGAALQRRDTPALPALTALTGATALPLMAALVPAAPASAAAPATAPSAQAVSDAASITVEYGVVKFYFSSGKADLAPGAGAALVDVVRAAGTGKKVVIAGFHDPKGNAAANAALARQRALAVRDALKAAGVKDSQITLQKPEQVVGSGSDAEARRVEITLQ